MQNQELSQTRTGIASEDITASAGDGKQNAATSSTTQYEECHQQKGKKRKTSADTVGPPDRCKQPQLIQSPLKYQSKTGGDGPDDFPGLGTVGIVLRVRIPGVGWHGLHAVGITGGDEVGVQGVLELPVSVGCVDVIIAAGIPMPITISPAMTVALARTVLTLEFILARTRGLGAVGTALVGLYATADGFGGHSSTNLDIWLLN